MNLDIIPQKVNSAYKMARWALKARAGGISAAVERPIRGGEIAEHFEIQGWCFAPGSSEVLVRAIIRPGNAGAEERSVYLPIEVSEQRADVAEFYSLESPVVGFRHSVAWNSVSPGCARLSLVVTFSNGRDELSVGPIELRRAEKQHDRVEYKNVWNQEADDIRGAMLAVAGYHSMDEFLSSGKSTADTIDLRLHFTLEDTVLDIGCGVGRIGKWVAPRCKKWIGCDVSGQMLRFAGEYLDGESNVELVEIDGYSLSEIESASIDKLYCSTVFMHLEEWDRFRYIKEAFRVLKAGGRCYFDNYNLLSKEGWDLFEQHCALDASERPSNISKASTEAELRQYFDKVGLVDVEAHYSGLYIELVGRKPA